MKKKLYALAATGLIATAMSAGYLISEQNKSNDSFKVIDIEKITDAEFDFSSYQKNKMNGEVFIKDGYFTPVGDKYIKFTLTYRNDDAQDTRVLVFDKKLNIVANIIFLGNKYLENEYQIESSITEKDGNIYYPEIADRFESYKGIKGIKVSTPKDIKTKKIIISVNGGEYKSIDDKEFMYSLSDYMEMVDKNTGYLAKSTFFDSRGACKETTMMISGSLECPENIYEVKSIDDSILISKRPVDFEFNEFAFEISKYMMKYRDKLKVGGLNWLARIEPITKDGEVNLISTPIDGFVMTVNDTDKIDIFSGVISFNKTLAINKKGELRLDKISKIDECRYALLGVSYKAGIDKIISIDTCKIKSI
jgi:hypothetical protein